MSTTRRGRHSKQAEETPALSFRDRLRALTNLPAFFRLIWATSPGLVLLSASLRLLRALLPVVTLYVGKLIIDEAARLVHLGGASWPALGHITHLVLFEMCLVLASDLLGRGIALADDLLGNRFSNLTSLRLMDHAARLELERFENATFYDMLERARQQTSSRVVLMTQVLAQLQDFVTIVSLATGLIVYSPWLILLLVVALIPSFWGEAHFSARSYLLLYSQTPERRELDYLRYIGASDVTAKEVKLFGLSGFIRDRFAEISDHFYAENKKLMLARAGWGTLLSALGTAGYYLAYGLILLRTLRGEQTLGDLIFLSTAFTRLKNILEAVLGRVSSMAEGALYLKDLFAFFALEPTIVAPPAPLPFPQPILQGFVFEDVGYQYTNADGEVSGRWALRHISFTLPVGERLALVGENGAGKTTLVKLIARLYDPTEGRILLDGQDLKLYDPDDLRREIGIIFQDFVRYQLVVSDNIAVGRIEARYDQPRIEAAAEASQAQAVIARLPGGYTQMIGKRFGAGVDLSGGEWQKVALARAYMRGAQLLILDEPTAALDARAEYDVFQRFAELTTGRTAILISHRFSTVRMADRILVLGGGGLLEQGTHEELLALKGRYAELFHLQARGYR